MLIAMSAMLTIAGGPGSLRSPIGSIQRLSARDSRAHCTSPSSPPRTGDAASLGQSEHRGVDAPRPDLAIAIPAFNEELRLQRALTRIRADATALGWDPEEMDVDDGSSDRTAQGTQEWSSQV